MRLIRLVLFFLLPPVMLSSTGVAKGQSSLDAFVPFNEFVASVRAADSGSYLGRSGASVESATAFEEMRKHVLSLYDGVAATNSFLIDSGYVDCIPILQQPTAPWLGLTEVPAPPPSPIKRTDQRPRPHTPLLHDLG